MEWLAIKDSVEWSVSIVLYLYVIVDVYIRLEAVRLALRYYWPVYHCHDIPISEELYQNWYLFLRWDRPIFYLCVVSVFYAIDFQLVLVFFTVKLLLDYWFHRFMVKNYEMFFPTVRHQ